MNWFSSSTLSIENTNEIKLVQITDVHLFASPSAEYFSIRPYKRLVQVLTDIKLNHADADVLIATGDFTQDHSKQSYQQFVLALQEADIALPVVWCPGNHDDIDVMSQIFQSAGILSAKRLKIGAWQVLLCNSKSATPAGYITLEHANEIMNCVNGIGGEHDHQIHQHTAVFCHHNPLPINGYLDKHKLKNGEEWVKQLAQKEQVKFVAHGHVHNEYALRYSGELLSLNVYATPATCAQFRKHTQDWQIDNKYVGYRTFNLSANGQYATDIFWLEGE